MTYSEVANLYNEVGVFERGYVPFRISIANAKTDSVMLDLQEAWKFHYDDGKERDFINIKVECLIMKNGIPTVEKSPICGTFQRRAEDLSALIEARKKAVETITSLVCPSEPPRFYKFLCSCGGNKFYRHPDIAKHCSTFLEGYFNCASCNREHDYCSSAFTKIDVITNKKGQTALF